MDAAAGTEQPSSAALVLPPTANAPIEFAPTDIKRLLPPVQPGEESAQRKQLEEQARQQLAVDRAYAVSAITGFRQTQTQHVASLHALAHGIESRLAVAEKQSLAEVSRTVTAQSQTVTAATARARAQVQAAQATTRAKIEADYAVSLVTLLSTTQAGRSRISDVLKSAQAGAQQAQSVQLALVAGLYAQADGTFRAAGDTAGSHASAMAAARASEYRAGKINRDDSLLDGPLTDNRCEAQADAAEKVGAAYRDELIKEAGKQTEAMRTRRPTDEATVREVARAAGHSLQETYDHSIHGLEDAQQLSLTSAARTRTALLENAERTLHETLLALTGHEQAQLAQLHGEGEQQKRAISAQRAQSVRGLKAGIEQATADLSKGLESFISGLKSAEVPEPKALDRTLADGGGRLDAQLAAFRGALDQAVVQATEGLRTTTSKGVAALVHTGTNATATAQRTYEGAHKSLEQLGTTGSKSLRDLVDGHKQAIDGNATACERGLQNVKDGLTSCYGQISTQLQQGFTHNAEAVRQGLCDVVDHDMPGKITDEAHKAYEQVKPRWQSVLKWVIIIALVLVVAIVLGPMVIGAIGGLAAGLGASATVASVVGSVVGGALVGAATSAATTVIDNAFSGRSLTAGLGTAIALGALTGGIGGGASSFLSGPLQGVSQLTRYGVQVGLDVTIDTGLNLATGNFSWQNFGTSLFMSMLTNGITAHPRVQAISESFTSRGYGSGYNLGVDLHASIHNAPTPPGPIVTPPNRADHISYGDTAGPNSPVAGQWTMSGGGHNANEIIPRANAEGMSHSTIARDPVTGVAIENFQRPATATARNKSLFPPSMDRTHIEAAAATGLQRAMAGAPGTQLTPPTASNANGSFTAIITTPEGHPITIKGHYRLGPTGKPEIQTVYPQSNLNAGTIPVVSGSRDVPIPTYATPPSVDQHDRDRQ